MPFATTAAIIGGISAASSLGGAAIASSGANNAANTQANAATTAAQIQAGSAQQALNFQKQQYSQQQTQMAPWLSSGTSALANLDYLLGVNPNGGAPTGVPPTSTAAATDSSGIPRPTTGVQLGAGDTTAPSPAASGNPVPSATGKTSLANLSSYGGQTFGQLTGSGDPSVSPDQQTTQAWKAAGIPTQNITTSDGRTVTIRTDTAPGGPNAAPAAGYTPPADLNSLVNPSLGAAGSLNQGWSQTFQSPTDVTEQNDPGYQFRLQQGQQALQRSAAASGGLLSGGTAKALEQYGQDYASNEYGNVYNRALTNYQQNYNTFANNQANQYNRLASLSGLGQVTAGQLGSAGQQAANTTGNILLQSGNAQASGINNAAAARGSAYQSIGNIYGNALSGVGNSVSGLLQQQQLAQLLNQSNNAGNSLGWSNSSPGVNPDGSIQV